MRLIDADNLKTFLQWNGNKVMPIDKMRNLIEALVDAQQTIEAEPVRHGTWKRLGPLGYGEFMVECSECGDRVMMFLYDDRVWKYCKKCGSKMDGRIPARRKRGRPRKENKEAQHEESDNQMREK